MSIGAAYMPMQMLHDNEVMTNWLGTTMQRRQQQQLYLNPDDPGLPSDELGCSAQCAAILEGDE
jgi:hypothetical protein